MTAEKIETWFATYKHKLADAIQRHPSQYRNHDANAVAAKTREVLSTKGIRHITINTVGWKSTAKHFGIANTYIAWEAWFKA